MVLRVGWMLVSYMHHVHCFLLKCQLTAASEQTQGSRATASGIGFVGFDLQSDLDQMTNRDTARRAVDWTVVVTRIY